MRQLSVGFTGTQQGLEPPQRESLALVLEMLAPMREFHHGDCVGADAEADDLANFAGVRRTYAHPCEFEDKRAHCACDVVFAPKHHKTRNREIAQAADVLLACPRAEEKSVPRSGTWQTVRLALQVGTPVLLVWPDGTWEPRGEVPSHILQLVDWVLPDERRVYEAVP